MSLYLACTNSKINIHGLCTFWFNQKYPKLFENNNYLILVIQFVWPIVVKNFQHCATFRQECHAIWSCRYDLLYPCEKKLAFLQLLRSWQKLQKSFIKASGIGTCGKAGFYAGLLKSWLLRSFYATLRKSCRKAGFSTAFTKILRRAS